MQLIPPFDGTFNAESNAERKFAMLLTAVDRSDAVAFHSFHLSRHRIQQMGEADFVVLWEGAVLVLEVKGGGLRRQDGKWFQTGRAGTHALAKAPLDQAREARFAFSDLVKRKIRDDYSYAFALVTPDCMLEDDFEFGSHEYIGQVDMSAAALEAKFDHMASVARLRPGGGGERWPKKDLSPLRTIMRRDLDGMMTLSHQAEFVERRRVELLAEQVDFLESARANPRVVLEGGAGTGKTLVALEGARREAQSGEDVTFVCSTQATRDVAAEILGPSRVELVLAEQLPLGQPTGLLVVDEAQDLMNPDDLDKLFASVRGGLDDGRWWLLVDNNHQAHVSGIYDEDSFALVTSVTSCARVRLPRNVRNTKPVIEAAQVYLGADLGSSRVGAGPPVEVKKAMDADQVMALLRARIQTLKSDGVSPPQMAVVTVDEDEGSPLNLLLGERRTPIDKVSVWTAREIKGLEVQHILVIGLDDLTEQRVRNLVYVGMTRSAISLWMAASPRAYAHMKEQAREHYAGTGEK